MNGVHVDRHLLRETTCDTEKVDVNRLLNSHYRRMLQSLAVGRLLTWISIEFISNVSSARIPFPQYTIRIDINKNKGQKETRENKTKKIPKWNIRPRRTTGGIPTCVSSGVCVCVCVWQRQGIERANEREREKYSTAIRSCPTEMTGFKLYEWETEARGERNPVFLWDPKHERSGTL